MKVALTLCAVFLVVLVAGTQAEELPPREEKWMEAVRGPEVPVHGDRHRRVTCDILSFNTPWGSLGHAACAAHCLSMNKGYRGGYCDNRGICNCRS